MLAAAVALLAGAALGYEVLLLRLFSLLQWHHFAAMVISLALLGYGVGGVVLALAGGRLATAAARWWVLLALAFAAAMPLAFLAAQAVEFNPLELLWSPSQWLRLGRVYLGLMVPFLLVALLLALTFEMRKARLGVFYGADLLGSGVGALAVAGLLHFMFAERLLPLLGAVAALGAGLGAWSLGRRRAAAIALLLVGVMVLSAGRGLPLHPNPFKALSQQLQVAGAKKVIERPGALARLTVVASPRVPLRHVPGLSLMAPTAVPEQLALFMDGDGPLPITRFAGDPGVLEHLEWTPEAAAWRLLSSPPRVLVLGAGTGTEVLRALRLGHAGITAVERNGELLALMSDPLAAFSGDLFERSAVRWIRAEARRFLERVSARWDLIVVPLGGGQAAAAAGLHAVQGDHRYTVEGVEAALARLAPGGVLAMGHWVHLPPREGVKLFATAVAALSRQGVSDPGRHLVWLRSWNTAVLFVRLAPFTQEEVARVAAFARARAFDLEWPAGLSGEPAPVFNRLPAPWFRQAARALAGPERASFIDSYPFHVAPATDDRPYFHRFFRWGLLPELVRQRLVGRTTLQETGYLILVATLVQALVVGGLLLMVPLGVRRLRGRGAEARGGAYFLWVGLAFMFTEMGTIGSFQRHLDHPILAVSGVLAVFLLFAGIGAWWSGRVPAWERRRALGRALALAVPLAAGLPWFLEWLADAVLHWPEPLRLAAFLAVTAPLALAMGFPFTLGLAQVSGAPAGIARAWAVNGFASVVGAVAAALLAVHLGQRAVLLTGASCYLAAAVAWPSRRADRGG